MTSLQRLLSLAVLGATIASSQAQSVRLPEFTRTAASPLEGGELPAEVVGGFDFDKDGNKDIATVDRSGTGRRLKIRFGNGSGGFSRHQNVASFTQTFPEDLAVGFLTGTGSGGATTDDRADVVVVSSGTLTVFGNAGVSNGLVQFSQPLSLSATGIELHAVTVADLDGDGRGDIVASGSESTQSGLNGRVVVFRNSASGFANAPQVLSEAGGDLVDVATGDLNQDGFLDIAAVEPFGTIAIYLSTSATAFAAPQLVELTREIPSALAIGDLFDTAAPEIVIWSDRENSNSTSAETARVVAFTILVQDANHQFREDASISFAPHAQPLNGDIAIADVNQDGNNDIIGINPADNKVAVLAIALTAERDLSFFDSPLKQFATSNRPVCLDVADFNGDTFTVGGTTRPKLDLVVGNLKIGGGTEATLDIFLNGAGGGGGGGGTALPKPGFSAKKPSSGDLVFKAKMPEGLTSGVAIRLQYSSTPDVEGSWQDVPGAFLKPNADRTSWTLKTQDLPVGTYHFRVIAAQQGKTDGISEPSKAFTLTSKVDLVVAELLRELPPKLSSVKGRDLIFNGTNIGKTTKQVKADQADFALFAFEAANNGDVATAFRFSGAASINGYGLRYFDVSKNKLNDITTAVISGSYQSKSVDSGRAASIYLAVRVPAASAKSALGDFDVTVTSNKTTEATDRARAQVKTTVPEGVVFVTTTADNGDSLSPTPGSMRAALVHAIRNFKKKTRIKFELPTTSNIATIPISTELPPLFATEETVIIDGTSQTEFLRAVRGDATIKGPNVELRGNGGGIGLLITTSDVLVKSVRFANFGTGLQISGRNFTGQKVKASGNVVHACEFEGNVAAGLVINDGASGNTVGGDQDEERNSFYSVRQFVTPVTGNHGIELKGTGTNENKIRGNYLGFRLENFEGVYSAGFNFSAVVISDGASGNIIGGRRAGEGNWIAGNEAPGDAPTQNGWGIEITGDKTQANFVQGNRFGIHPNGTARPNRKANIVIKAGANDNLIGGSERGQGNLIQGCMGDGVYITEGAFKNRIENNTIGGSAAIERNLGSGVYISGQATTRNRIGNTINGTGNLIVGNGQAGTNSSGVRVIDAVQNFIIGNHIGTDPNNTAIPNQNAGVYVLAGSDTLIGEVKGFGNTISGNAGRGIILDGTSATRVLGNRIGVGDDGTTAVPNTQGGVLITNGASENFIGSPLVNGGGNIIRGNNGKGVQVVGNSQFNSLRGNNWGIATQFLPIDLVGGVEDANGATANDTNDADEGPNFLLNAPRITGFATKNGNTVVRGEYHGVANAELLIDFHIDGKYLDTLKAKTDASGNYAIDVTLPRSFSGKVITLLATPGDGNTSAPSSEFSNSGIPN